MCSDIHVSFHSMPRDFYLAYRPIRRRLILANLRSVGPMQLIVERAE